MSDSSPSRLRPQARPAPTRPQARPDRDLMVAAETPENVAETASEEAFLPLEVLALVGIFDKPEGTTALLREPDGTIVSVQQGDAAGRMTVTALKPDAVYLSDGNGHSQVLRMPA